MQESLLWQLFLTLLHKEDPEKPSESNECGAASIHGSHLVWHQHINTGEKPYGCQDRSPIQHDTIHTGEKPYKCIKHEKAFEYRSHLMRHRWIQINLQINPVSTKNVGRPSPSASVFSCIPTHIGEKPFEGTEGRRAVRNHTGEEPEEHVVLESI